MKSQISTALAELLGMHAGDGTLYQTKRSVVWELRGNLDEKEFYDTHVTSIMKQIGFVVVPKARSGGKNGCYGVRSCDKEFINLLLQSGFIIGSKTKTVAVPSHIKASQELKCAFLRGLFATDGTIYLARVNGKTEADYPMIELGSASEQLRDDVQALLQELGMKSYAWTYNTKGNGGPCHYLRLAGKAKALQFSDIIGFSNPKHQRIAENIRNV